MKELLVFILGFIGGFLTFKILIGFTYSAIFNLGKIYGTASGTLIAAKLFLKNNNKNKAATQNIKESTAHLTTAQGEKAAQA